MRYRLPLLLALILVVGCAGEPYPIDRAEVTRIIETLASDQMRGRAAASSEAMEAAAFIADEFARNGLEPMEGATGFIREFPVYTFEVERTAVRLGDRELPESDVLASLSRPTVSWSPGEGPDPTFVGPDEDPIAVARQVRMSGEDALLVFHRDHWPAFDRLRRIFRSRVVTMDPESAATVVAVVSSDAPGTWSVEAAAAETETTLANVAGRLPGRRADEQVLFSAHYDHIGVVAPADGDSIANGANDDASGVTAVIELARYFHERGTPERTLLFVAFTAEESGGFGSRHFAGTVDPDDIVAMFNIEMIGKPAVEGPNSAWITGFDRSDFGTILQRAVEGTPYEFHPDPYPDQNLFYRSDNATLARLGVPAHSISTTPIDVDPDYHRVTDEVETLDLDHMTATIRAIAAGAATIVSGAETPTRVAPEG